MTTLILVSINYVYIFTDQFWRGIWFRQQLCFHYTIHFYSVELNLNGQLDQYKTRVIIRYDGQHKWYIPAIITAGCSIDIRFFPFDYQKCPMQFGSWSFSSPELDLEVTRDDIDLDFYQESSQFWLIKTRAVRNSIKYRFVLFFLSFTIVVTLSNASGTLLLVCLLTLFWCPS